jgi:hypothetical protein
METNRFTLEQPATAYVDLSRAQERVKNIPDSFNKEISQLFKMPNERVKQEFAKKPPLPMIHQSQIEYGMCFDPKIMILEKR